MPTMRAAMVNMAPQGKGGTVATATAAAADDSALRSDEATAPLRLAGERARAAPGDRRLRMR